MKTDRPVLAACAIGLAGFTFVAGATAESVAVPSAGIDVEAENFVCLQDMTRVRHFYVDNLLGDLEGTLTVAHSPTGGTYPAGSMVQLVPTEVMVKHKPGWNTATRDWEFFELDVSEAGTSIRKRGFVDVVNRFGGNCFGCHLQARPEWDLICEQGHGCDTIPITREQIAEIQKADPRCK
ncbi:MAG: hypothetical protein E2O54_00670 [Gammaproteobacteria bacterium]|nr:MAG: hypothetical protein E2O54_00670 [Gammaproteobacteria bacterium]